MKLRYMFSLMIVGCVTHIPIVAQDRELLFDNARSVVALLGDKLACLEARPHNKKLLWSLKNRFARIHSKLLGYPWPKFQLCDRCAVRYDELEMNPNHWWRGFITLEDEELESILELNRDISCALMMPCQEERPHEQGNYRAAYIDYLMKAGAAGLALLVIGLAVSSRGRGYTERR